MDYKALDREIDSGLLKPLYLFFGDEEYGKDNMMKKLTATLDETFADFNLSYMDDPAQDALIAVCEQLPMMDNRRIVIVKNSRYLADVKPSRNDKNKGGSNAAGSAESGENNGDNDEKDEENDKDGDGGTDCAELIAYAESPNPATTLVFLKRGNCDKRKKLYKVIEKSGGLVSFDPLSGAHLSAWAVNYAASLGAMLGRREADMMTEMTGNDLTALKNELDKVCAMSNYGKVETAQIARSVIPSVEYSTLKLVDDLTSGRKKQAMETLSDTLETDGAVALYMMVGFVANKLRQMLSARRFIDGGATDKQAEAMLKIHPYAAKLTVKAANKYSTEKLEMAVKLLCEADEKLKSETTDKRTLLETTLLSMF